MKIITANVNGFRAASAKGLLDWLLVERADMICLQEVKADLRQVDISPLIGYEVFWNAAQKKGYSGVALLTKVKPLSVLTSFGHDLFDSEGRYILAVFDDISLLNVYVPSGTSGDERQQIKYEFLDFFYPKLLELSRQYSRLVVCGDFNICHTEIDIHNPVSNKNSSGFLLPEREWISKLLDSGFIDVFRLFESSSGYYTWFSHRHSARERNMGWRIDYFFSNFRHGINSCKIDNTVKFSDHLPVLLQID